MSEDIAEYISDFDAKLRGTCLKSWDKVQQNYFFIKIRDFMSNFAASISKTKKKRLFPSYNYHLSCGSYSLSCQQRY